MLKKLATVTFSTIVLTIGIFIIGTLNAGAAKESLSVKSVETTSTSATLTLSKGSKANYITYSENRNFSDFSTVDVVGTTVKISGLKPETTYYFKAVTRSARIADSSGGYISAKTEPVVSPSVDYSSIVTSAMRVEFKKNAECSGYRMLISENSNFTYTTATQGSSSLRFDYLKPNTTYYLKAYTFVTINGSNYFSKPVVFNLKTKALPKATVNYKKSNSVESAMRIEFNKASDINGYKLCIADNKKFTGEKTVQGGSSLRFDYLKPDTTYYLKAYTYKTLKGKNYLSEPVTFSYDTKDLPEPTVDLKASNSVESAIRIEFDKVSGVSGYKMLISDNKSFAGAKSVKGGSSLRFDYLKPDTTYYIKAYTYKTINGNHYYSPTKTFSYNTKSLPKPTVNYHASNSVESAIRIEFDKVSGVSGYKMLISDDKSFAGAKSVKGGSSLRFDYLKPNTTYYLKAYTYKKIGDKYYYSDTLSFSYKTKPSPAAPTGVKATNGMYQISWNTWGPQYTISWNGVSKASYYNVYESSSRNGSFRKVGSVSGTSYTVTEPSLGDHYYIIKTVSGGVEGKASAVCGIRYVGIFSTTGYCANYGAQTADGSYCASGHTVAAGYAYAFGTYFKIGDHGYTYEVEDRGGAVSNSVIDIYFDSYAEACNWGRRWLPVYQIL